MPYVNAESRHALRHGRPPMTVGELNYAITLELIDFVKNRFPAVASPEDAGEVGERLENRLYELMRKYWDAPWNKKNYELANGVMGASVSAVFELSRRMEKFAADGRVYIACEIAGDAGARFYADVVAPYEDKKIKENGDVYPPEFA